MKNVFSKVINIALIVVIVVFIGKKWYLAPKQSEGEKAPDFSVTLLAGEEWKLSDHQNELILLDFWAPWCGPCRRENPQLVDLFEKYKDSKFTHAEKFSILNIAIENNRTKWFESIRKDQLKWPLHAIEAGDFSGEITTLYKVREIPRKYLVGPEGHIVLVNPKVKEIDEYLSKYVETAGKH